MSGVALRSVLLLFVLLASSLPVHATKVEDKDSWCDESRHRHDARALFCEVRELRLPPPRGVLSVDGGMNGGIQVIAWERDEVLVHAKVEVWADSEEEAAAMAGRIRVLTAEDRIHAEGPDESGGSAGRWWGRHTGWGVSYRIYVPQRTDLALATHNGGVAVTGVAGRISMQALNGALALRDVGGDVRGRTVNGSLVVDLNGERWNGKGLDLRTTNGSVEIQVPEHYSMRLVTGTTNGRMRVDFPIQVQGEMGKRVRVDVGERGAPSVRAITTNGSVKVWRAG